MLKPILILIAALTGFATFAPLADARPRDREQDAAFKAMHEGRIMSLRSIESRILPRMGDSDYLGAELDTKSRVYRLKFMRGVRVIWVDVDARTGRVLGKSGS